MAFKFSTGIQKNLLQNFFSRVASVASVFLINVTISRLLGAAGSGELYFVVNNFSIIVLLASLSLESGMTYFLSKKEVEEKELITISFVWTFAVGLLIAVILFLNRNRFQIFRDQISLYSFLFIVGTLLSTYFSSLFFGRKQFFYPHLIPSLVNLIFFLYAILFILYGEKNTTFLILAYFISSLASGILMSISYYLKYRFRFSLYIPAIVTFVKLYRYSGLAFITNIVSFLAYRVDYWILKGFSSRLVTEAALGNYIQVSKLVQLFLFLPTVMATIIFPVSASSADFNPKEVKRMALQALAVNLTGCFILVSIGNWFFVFLYGKSFALMYLCFVFSIPLIIAMTVVRIISSYFAGINKIKYNLLGCSITLGIVVIANFLLIPSMGINGSALADSIGYIAFMIVLIYLFNRFNFKREKHSVVN